MIRNHKQSSAFSLIEILVALSILSVLAAILVPQYLALRKQSNLGVAQQQVDTVHKAVLAWLAAQPSVSAGNLAYDGWTTTNTGTTGYASGSAWAQISANYLDQNFASQLTVKTNNNVTYFTTPQMTDLTSGTTAASIPSSLPAGSPSASTVIGAMAPPSACGVIYWLRDSQSRLTGQPVGILYYKQ